MSTITERFSNRVQAAQTTYCDVMAVHRLRVDAGELTEAAYWRIADGAPLRVCGAEVAAATAEYGAALAAVAGKGSAP